MMEYKKWQKGSLRPDRKHGFDTPTGKFEISSTILEDYGYEPLPKYTEPTEGPLASPDLARRFPLVFNSGARPQTDFCSQRHGIEGIRSLVPGASLNGHRERRLPNTLNMTLPGLRGESLVIALDRYGISLSSGSACKSGSPEPTHVLMAMGRPEDEAHCAVRLSLSHDSTGEDVDETVKALGRVLEDRTRAVRPCARGGRG